MNFKTRSLFGTLLCLFATIALLITCVDSVVMNRSFYTYAYEKLNTADSIGMSSYDLYEATDTLLDYLQDYRDDIVVKVEVNGFDREAFDRRETLHMVDVKNLYQGVCLIRNVFVGFCIFLLAILIYDDKKGLSYLLTYTYQRFYVMFALFIGALITYAACDFTTFWTHFHHVFFTNDLWLLDPRVSIMINMFPEPFFFAMVFVIAGVFILISLSLWIYSYLYQKKIRKNKV